MVTTTATLSPNRCTGCGGGPREDDPTRCSRCGFAIHQSAGPKCEKCGQSGGLLTVDLKGYRSHFDECPVQ